MPPDFRAPIEDLLAESLAAPLPSLISRRIAGPAALPGKATAVIGMRRAGKTTFLHQIRQERMAAGTPRERLPYINFEDERLAGLTAKELHLFVDAYYRAFPSLRGHERVTLCLDEIQVVPGWERFVRRLLDAEEMDLFVSGSSAALLSREIATSMRGRAWEVVIHPFGFEEHLRSRGLALPRRPELASPPERSTLEAAFHAYLQTGGFPEVQALQIGPRHRVLRDYVDVAVFRDVVERHEVTNVSGLHWLVRHLLGNAAALFSVEKFYGTLRAQGVNIAKDTVHALVAHLTDCFLVRSVWIEAASERRRRVNPRKVYPVDPGLIPVFDRSGRSNLGHALETVVLIELERRGLDVTYVRTAEGYEVDFLARAHSGEEELIQVCADASQPETAMRELRALEVAGREHPRATRRLLVATRDGLPGGVPREVAAQPAYEWLLPRA